MEIQQYQDNTPAIADDFLLQIADQAEKRIDAVIKIKQVALKVTNARDWTDQQGNPYLQVSGSEKIANLFNMSWRIEEPQYEEEPDGHFTYSIKGTFSLGGRTIEVWGTRSSKDGFFKKYEYVKVEGKQDEKTLQPPSAIDKGDVKKAALTNLFGNGITRMLGIRNLTWDDLQKFAGISQEMVKSKVSYNQREAADGKPDIAPPQKKSEATKSTASDTGDTLTAVIDNYIASAGDKKPWAIIADGKKLTSFDKKLIPLAESLKGQMAVIHYEKKGNFFNLTGIGACATVTEDTGNVPEGCTQNPARCDFSIYGDGDSPIICGENGPECKFKGKGEPV